MDNTKLFYEKKAKRLEYKRKWTRAWRLRNPKRSKEVNDISIQNKIKKIGKLAYYKLKNDSVRKWRLKNPIKNRAHKIVFTEIRAGRLRKEPCRVCGNIKAEAHHDDYTKPLNIIWLCKLHHEQLHTKKL